MGAEIRRFYQSKGGLMFYGQCWKCGERWGLDTAPTCKCKNDDDDTMCYRSELEAAVRAEREACARLAEEWLGPTKDRELHIAAAIRARGDK